VKQHLGNRNKPVRAIPITCAQTDQVKLLGLPSKFLTKIKKFEDFDGKLFPLFFGGGNMCDVHLCDKAIQRIFEEGPGCLLILPPRYAIHLAECKTCSDKLVDLIMLSILPPESEKVM